ncbi:alpha-1,2-mannosyltransferase [Microdochium bolleyi]|uniref:Alpha-1,2-mannosyltransferase n=1 Tax=Microdochium bolleyi TaxID=196109 RepID=A0A136IXX4_9PEZI|nr:alpha-1,2-mannosyltransferase [Microdochium bolleyi]
MFWPAVGLLFCIATFLGLSKATGQDLLSRLGIRRASVSRPTTPNVEKQPLAPSADKPPTASSTAANLKTTFPPSQREQLVQLRKHLPATQQAALGDPASSCSEETFQQSLLRMDEDYRTSGDSRYSYTGFSVREIKALGDFPDYAGLSGVPLPQAYREFDIDRAKPRPYRPFRWGYHQTMSLTKLDTDWWLELESTYKSRIAQRQQLYRDHGPDVLQALPGSELACKELMEMVVQFLCARYPQYFSLHGAEGKTTTTTTTTTTTLHNRILGTTTVLSSSDPDVEAVEPLHVLLNNVPEDFAMTLRDPETGYYHFRAGVICSSLGWNVATKIGLRLDEIHKIVPDYKEKMAFSMDRFFSKMPTSKPIQRGSWGLEVSEPLYLPPGHPHLLLRQSQCPTLTPSEINLRVDWQTLRRLPLSGSIVFNFKALFTPVTEFRDEPGVPGLCAHVLRHGKREIMRYKDTWHVEHVVVPLLEGYDREQVEKGLWDGEWEPKTLEESPWFPGWEEKWHRQQGF